MRPRTSPYETLTVYLLAACTVLADQFAKAGVVAAVALGHSVPLIEGYLHLTHVRNFGAAFSLFWGLGPFLSAIAMAVALGVMAYQWRVRPRRLLVVLSLGFLLGGAVGNLLDRLLLGYVRDMVDLRFAGQNVWPIFNLADVAILAGGALMIGQTLRAGRRREKVRPF